MCLKNVKGKIRCYLRIAPVEKRLFLEAFFVHIWVWFILLFIPFRRIPELFSNSGSKVKENNLLKLNRFRSAIRRASDILPFRNRCLVSSLAARLMLKRRKIESEISLGVAKIDGGKISAHAWISSDGYELVEQEGDYKVMYTF